MRLLTFGDSWSYGIGAGYQDSWTLEDYHKQKSDKDIADKYAFRTILAKELHAEENKDFSRPGGANDTHCLLYTSPSPRDYAASRMPSSA